MKVNFVIYVVNGLSVLKSLENAGALERGYTDMVASSFNCPYLSFKGICKTMMYSFLHMLLVTAYISFLCILNHRHVGMSNFIKYKMT